jgi:type I restriction enzyme, R subunit
MNGVGKPEAKTQKRVVDLFTNSLGYKYFGNLKDRTENSNIEEELLIQFLRKDDSNTETLIHKAIFELNKVATNQQKTLYDINKELYSLLRYGVKVQEDVGQNTQTVWLIDWDNPSRNNFYIAEEVTIQGIHNKRPDIVLYVNGIALGVLELKRSTVSVVEGIRQNLDNQKEDFIRPFFHTIQFVMAGNDTEGLRYGAIETSEKYYLSWKEDSPTENLLDKHLSLLCEKNRFLELIHDFIVFDRGIKKLCRHNQYFAVRASHKHIHDREGGIIWHTQGSGKSLTMVWLAKWIKEHIQDARVLIITDRDELDKQIEKVFMGVEETIYRTKSGADLISKLNDTNPWLICSLIHKFGRKEKVDEKDVETYLEEINNSLPRDFKAKGNLIVFVDECHRSHSNLLHDAMKKILGDPLLIGFTGTPLLKKDKKKSIEVFGPYIHTYKFDEAVQDNVVLDLQYEARSIDQDITSQERIDQWFEAKTRGLTEHAKMELKRKWGTMKAVLSSQSRLEKIVEDIMLDMAIKDRLQNGRGNAMLVSGSIYEACKYYDLFKRSGLRRCAIVTSYVPNINDIRGETTGEERPTEKLKQYEIYNTMLADWFNEDPNQAMNKVDQFEEEVKEKFIYEPAQMKLLIVVDKLLTGFDAPPATYLYIDKSMRDHGLFQAICRVNRLDGDDKEYGYIIDYKDLFRSLEKSMDDYTSEAFDKYDKEDVEGLLKDRLEKAKERLDNALESIKALCEPVEPPKNTYAYIKYFCGNTENREELKDNEQKRQALYKYTASLIRAYADLANEMNAAGYSQEETQQIKKDVKHYETVKEEIKKASGDYIDLKKYESDMRYLIDTYIGAEDSRTISAFDEMTLVDLIVEKGEQVVDTLPQGIRQNQDAAAETIENNIRRLIIDEIPTNPRYFERMSELLDQIIQERRRQQASYEEYLRRIVDLAKQVKEPSSTARYPSSLNTNAKRALYDNLDKNEDLAINIHQEIISSKHDDWRGNTMKERVIRNALKRHLNDEEEVERIFELVKNQRGEY